MSNISVDLIKELRDQTGVAVMQCRKALEEAGGDIEKARIILSKQSSAAAEKKADRALGDGLVVVKQGGNKAVMLVLFCETDFVAKNEEFIAAANKLAEIALAEGEDAMRTQSGEIINPLIQKIGENMQVGSVYTFDNGTIGSYVHNGRNASVVVLEGGDESLAKDIAMHISAMKPHFIKKDDITEDDKVKVTEVFQKEVDESDKPADMKAKILEGKLSAYFKEKILLEQPFIKDPSMTIGQLASSKGATVVRFEQFNF